MTAISFKETDTFGHSCCLPVFAQRFGALKNNNKVVHSLKKKTKKPKTQELRTVKQRTVGNVQLVFQVRNVCADQESAKVHGTNMTGSSSTHWVCDATETGTEFFDTDVTSPLRSSDEEDWRASQQSDSLSELSETRTTEFDLSKLVSCPSPATNTNTRCRTTVTLVNYPLQNSVVGVMTALTLACLQGSPEAVLLLLRHGARPLHSFTPRKWSRFNISQPLYATVNQLNRFSDDVLTAFKNHKNATPDGDKNQLRVTNYTASPMFRMGSQSAYHSSIMNQRGDDWLQCLVYLSLVMKTWPLKMTHDVEHERPEAEDVLLVAGYAEYLQEMGLHRGQITPSLQHLCRCVIRDTLAEPRRLPEGIYQLPLPTRVKKYIDLQM